MTIKKLMEMMAVAASVVIAIAKVVLETDTAKKENDKTP